MCIVKNTNKKSNNKKYWLIIMGCQQVNNLYLYDICLSVRTFIHQTSYGIVGTTEEYSATYRHINLSFLCPLLPQYLVLLSVFCRNLGIHLVPVVFCFLERPYFVSCLAQSFLKIISFSYSGHHHNIKLYPKLQSCTPINSLFG